MQLKAIFIIKIAFFSCYDATIYIFIGLLNKTEITIKRLSLNLKLLFSQNKA